MTKPILKIYEKMTPFQPYSLQLKQTKWHHIHKAYTINNILEWHHVVLAELHCHIVYFLPHVNQISCSHSVQFMSTSLSLYSLSSREKRGNLYWISLVNSHVANSLGSPCHLINNFVVGTLSHQIDFLSRMACGSLYGCWNW